MTESGQSNNGGEDVDQMEVTMLISIGFDRERSCLALKLTQNDLDSAVDLLTSEEGATLESLNALVQ